MDENASTSSGVAGVDDKVDTGDYLSANGPTFIGAVHPIDTTYDVDHILDPRSDKLVLCKDAIPGRYQQDLQRIPGRHPEKVCDCMPVDTALNLLPLACDAILVRRTTNFK